MNQYMIGDVAKRFGVTNNTVRRWAREYFTEFMSHEARPEKGGYHKFNDMDLGVFATWVRLDTEGKSVEEAKAFLRNGERDVPPDEPMSDDQKNMVMNQAAYEVTQLRQEVMQLENEIERLRNELEDEKGKTSSESGKKDLALNRLDAAEKRIEELIGETVLLKYQLDSK
jgi:DNA-binding transcriptional MerR regulator